MYKIPCLNIALLYLPKCLLKDLELLIFMQQLMKNRNQFQLAVSLLYVRGVTRKYRLHCFKETNGVLRIISNCNESRK